MAWSLPFPLPRTAESSLPLWACLLSVPLRKHYLPVIRFACGTSYVLSKCGVG